VTVRLGLRDVASTYQAVFNGRITDIGGAGRTRTSLVFDARDDFDRVNVDFPTEVLTKSTFPDLEDNFVGMPVPVIYGDWTAELDAGDALVPAFPVNGKAAGVLAGTANVLLLISANDNALLDTSNIYIKKDKDGKEFLYVFNAADIIAGAGNKSFELKQVAGGGVTLIEGVGYTFESGDEFFVRVKGKDLGSYSDNIVWQARDILMTYGGAISSDFDSSWATYRDKASPSQSAISTIKSRVWVQETQQVMTYVLSMFEQVRLECFMSRELKFKITSLHFDEFQAAPSFVVKNWDVEMDTIAPKLDTVNVWNRAQADYSFSPRLNENSRTTPIYRNSAAITQAGKPIGKKVVFPNLYKESEVISQLTEMLKLASSYSEFIEMTLTPRAILKDIGDFVLINVKMGATVFENVPAQIRSIGYDPKGLRVPVKVWSFQMVPFPGYAPTHPGIVGGSTATITAE
jgi:hypothetical protein